MKTLIFPLLFLICFSSENKIIANTIVFTYETENIQLSPDDTLLLTDTSAFSKLTPKELRKRRLVSAMLAFPFPFGFVGAHRVMLGCKPWVPIVYVATFGGCFGLLPLMDFCAIVFSKDIEQYENNPHIFMWMK